MGKVVITRTEQNRPLRSSRDFEERLMVRFPRAWRVLAALALRLLSPQSRLRRAFGRRTQVSAYAAASRRDYELMLVRYSREVEVRFDPEMEALGLGGTFRGHEGLLKIIETFGEAWEQWEIHPAATVDMGDRFLGLGRFRLPGTASGLELEREFAQLVTFRGGLVAHEQQFLDWGKGLRAAGLDPDAIELGSREQALGTASAAR